MTGPSANLWTVMSTARTIRRFTDEPVDDVTLARCLEAATWAPSGANAQQWRFVVLRSPESRAVVATAAARALEVIEPAYRMTRPAEDDNSRRARTDRATYELHDRAGAYTSVLFLQERFPQASDLLLGGSIFPATAVGVPDNWMLAAHAVVGWPRGKHGAVRRRPLADVVFLDRWDERATDIVDDPPERPTG
jgi:nitroreductase